VPAPSEIVVATVFVAVLITVTVAAPEQATYTFDPSALATTPSGEPGTVIVAVNVWFPVLITDTVPPPILAM
jgi:hypothetical protein